ncbi:MAG: HpcH/HpaI aldolase family protein [Beijerinckiaceae bacterium]
MHPVTSLPAALQNAPLYMGWCGMADPVVAGLIARAGYDAVLLDQQHGAFNFDSAAAGITEVTGAGKPCLVRIPVGDFAMASRMLDMGASAIVAPMINTVADARALASFMKLPPDGDRSWGPARALNLTGLSPADYLKQANSFSLAIAMIETREAMNNLEAILDVPGIDGILVGPSDLSIALSHGASVDAFGKQVTDASADIARRTRARNKIACAFSPTGERAKVLTAMGYQLVSLETDQIMLRNGAAAALKAAKA